MEGIKFPNPDFAALASACGGHGFKAAKPRELRTAIAKRSMSMDRRSSTVSWPPMNCPTCRISTWRRSGTTQWAKIKEAGIDRNRAVTTSRFAAIVSVVWAAGHAQ